jgi:surfactin synthase thioesterase subunit
MTEYVLFPGAGSFGGELQPLVAALGEGCRVVRYPGRFGRGFGVPADSFEELVSACAEQITWPAPVLVGHSFGAYVAFATASRLRQPAGLVVVGAAAPALHTVSEQATRSPEDAARYLAGVDPSALANAPSDEWREIVAETVVQDLRLLTRFDPATAPVSCPIHAARGSFDPLTTDASMRAWQHSTKGAFTQRTFPGGHSDLLGTDAFAGWLRDLPTGAG